MTDTGTAVAALTAAWLRELSLDRDTVVSGAGLWPLLGLLAGAADGPTREELAGAVGMDADTAADAAASLLADLDASPDIAAASGTWTRPGIPLHDWWRAHVPPESIGELTTQAALDAWASERTDGLIEKMPIDLTPDIQLVLATALLLRTTWQARFEERRGPGRTWLHRSTSGVDDVAAVAGAGGPVTVATVRGEQDVDVLLGIGPEPAAPADVLAALLTGGPAASGTQLLDGAAAPAVTVHTVPGNEPSTALDVPAFEVRCKHNLLEQADVLGLRSACAGGFGRLSPVPLQLDQAAQDVLARFFATGFEAAAVTSMAFVLSGRVREPETRELAVRFDRPFGFAALHRPTGVPVVAGWIADVDGPQRESASGTTSA